ncbi:unnamed protein product [Fasciola hepatica]|uniref:Cadherin domain-containing protein n=1 Tax=Fasciola hepatica TaxID=6192 RepID=A0ABC9HJB9_FASHE
MTFSYEEIPLFIKMPLSEKFARNRILIEKLGVHTSFSTPALRDRSLQFKTVSACAMDIFVAKPIDRSWVNQDKTPNRISRVRLQPNEIESAGRIQYSMEENVVQKSVVRIDRNNGELEFPTALSPMSMAVTVRATAKTGSNQYVTAFAVVRVHVVCFVSSHAWDTIRNLASIKFINPIDICHFQFRNFNIRSEDDSSSNLDEPNAVHLSYRIRFRRFGCLVRSSLRCTVSEGVQLTNATIGEIGSGMKCPNELSRPTMFSIGRKSVDLNLGDLCGTGNEDSWIDIAVVVSVNDEPTQSFIDCATFVEQTVIADSRLRHWIKTPSEYGILKRNRRSNRNITLTIKKDEKTDQMNRPKSVTFVFYIPKGTSVNLASLSLTCPKSSGSNKPQCTVKRLRLSKGINVKFKDLFALNITDFNSVQQNRIQVNLTKLEATDENGDQMANTLSLEFEVRPTHCTELQTDDSLIVHFEGRFDAYLLSEHIQITVRNEGQPITDFDLKMHINTTDVYPADIVQINVTVKNTELSQCECKLLMLHLHAGPWVTDGELIDVGKQNTKLDKTESRRMEILVVFWTYLRHYRWSGILGYRRADHGNSYTCVFKNHFRARGLRIIPTKPVLKHKVTQFGVHLYGIAFGKDIHQFDLGPMVSQVITYQKEDKRYFALGPERNSIVSTRDLTDNWIGITISEYRKYTVGRQHENATYLPWDETDTFNKTLSGENCTNFQAAEWNVCCDGIYYKNKKVAAWTKATDLPPTPSE